MSEMQYYCFDIATTETGKKIMALAGFNIDAE